MFSLSGLVEDEKHAKKHNAHVFPLSTIYESNKSLLVVCVVMSKHCTGEGGVNNTESRSFHVKTVEISTVSRFDPTGTNPFWANRNYILYI